VLTRIFRMLAIALFLSALAAVAVALQNEPAHPAAPAKPRHVYTNDDLTSVAPQPVDGVPDIPGLIKCGTDLKCFLQALDSRTPAAVTRNETAEEMNGVVTATSTW
jgi:hypothetical protein